MPKKTRTAKPTTSEAAGPVQAAAEWAPADSLVEWKGNPRTNQPVEEVALSILRLGFGAPIVARRTNRQIIAGHTRLKAFRFLQAHVRDVTDDFWVPRGAGDGEFVVRDAPGPGLVPVRFVDVTEAEAQALALADNRLGEKALWDDEGLASALRSLQEWEFAGVEDLGWSVEEINEILDPPPPREPYTSKIVPPVYEPKGERPELSELYDTKTTAKLIADIDAADIPDDQRAFLRAAASRHTVFHYKNIAEWYCHATPEVQRLMERSALVIIDFNRAIEYGFVRMTETMMRLADDEERES